MQSRAINIPLPGFSTVKAQLIELDLPSFQVPLQTTNYAIVWDGKPNPEAEEQTFAQSRSGVPARFNPSELPSGDYNLTATAYSPSDTDLLDPLGSKTISFKIGSNLKVNSQLAHTTNNGQSQPLAVRITRPAPSQPGRSDAETPVSGATVTLALTAGNGSISNATGTTDADGYFRTNVSLTQNLSYALFDITAVKGSDNGNGMDLLTDPCTAGDAAEPTCQPNANTDPNFQSHDGLQSITYDGGDHIYTRTLNGKVELQARHSGPWGQIEQIAIRDGFDVVQFNLITNAINQGDIKINRQPAQLTDAKPWIYLPDSGMVIVRHIPQTGEPGSIADAFTVITSTGDHFEIGTRHATLDLTSSIVSRGQIEGILGDADGNRLNDLKPRGNSTPLPIRTNFPYNGSDHYSRSDYNNFVGSWRVYGADSLFDTPFRPDVTYFDAWTNPLSKAQMDQGFAQFRQFFGDNIDPYLAWRFTMDLNAGYQAQDLRSIYQRLVDQNLPTALPPRDADLNNNGVPDIREPQLWNFKDEAGYVLLGSTRKDGEEYILTPAANFQIGGLSLPAAIPNQQWKFDFDFKISQGTATFADGLAFSYDPSLTLTGGGGLGLPPDLLGGFAVAIDTFKNGAAVVPELQIRRGSQGLSTRFGENNALAKVTNPGLVSSSWQHATVVYNGSTINVTFGTSTLSAPFQAPTDLYVKVVAATGGFNSEHRIRNPIFTPLDTPAAGQARIRRSSNRLPISPESVKLMQPNPDKT